MRGNPSDAFDKAFELAARLAEAMRHALAEHGLTASRAEVIYPASRRLDYHRRLPENLARVPKP